VKRLAAEEGVVVQLLDVWSVRVSEVVVWTPSIMSISPLWMTRDVSRCGTVWHEWNDGMGEWNDMVDSWDGNVGWDGKWDGKKV